MTYTITGHIPWNKWYKGQLRVFLRDETENDWTRWGYSYKFININSAKSIIDKNFRPINGWKDFIISSEGFSINSDGYNSEIKVKIERAYPVIQDNKNYQFAIIQDIDPVREPFRLIVVSGYAYKIKTPLFNPAPLANAAYRFDVSMCQVKEEIW